GGAVWVLRREPLVYLIVRVEYDLGPGGVQVIPQRLELRQDLHTRRIRHRAEAGMVPVGERAQRWVGGEIGAKPLLLRRIDPHVDGRVEHDDVPAAELVAVVPVP